MAERTSNTLPPGYQLDEYVIGKVLGIGGFGITYKAEDNLHRAVAIKEYMPVGIASRSNDAVTVHPASANHTEDFEWGLDRFRMEAQTLVAFRHPNIVSVFRYFAAHGTAYLVMEFQEGQTLADLLHPDKTLSEEEIDEFLSPLLDGLEEVHSADFAHRDIKPGNIFIRKDGSPVLIDFGAARQAMGSHSRALTSIVTAGYAPYEQYETDTVQGPWTDIYALGATLYRCVTGQRPIDAPRRAGAVMRGEADPNPAASEVAKGKYSERLLHAIDRSLEVLEQNRPQSVADLRAILRGDEELERQTVLRPAAAGEITGETRPRAGTSAPPTRPADPHHVDLRRTDPRPAPVRPAASRPAAARPAPPPAGRAGAPAAPRKRAGAAFWVGLIVALVIGGGATAGGVWYYLDQQEQAEIIARKNAEEKARVEAERRRLEEEARRKAEADRKRLAEEEARRKAEADKLRRQQEEEARRKAEADRLRRQQEEDERNKIGNLERDPNTNNNNNNNTTASRDGTWRTKSTVLAPANYAGILGEWCSPDYKIRLTRNNFFTANRKTEANGNYKLVRYEFYKDRTRFHYQPASGGSTYGVYEFAAVPGDPTKLRLVRTFYAGKWTDRSSVYSRNCN